MTCAEAEDQLLESFDEPLPQPRQRALGAHLAGCRTCAAFATSMRLIDTQLAAVLPPPAPPPSLAQGIRRNIRRERLSAVSESLPDIIHLTGCAVATALSAALLPFEAAATVAAGIGGTFVTYVFMVIVRWSIEAADQPDW